MKKEHLQYYQTLNQLTPQQRLIVDKYLPQSTNDKTIGRLQDAIELADYENHTNTADLIFANHIK